VAQIEGNSCDDRGCEIDDNNDDALLDQPCLRRGQCHRRLLRSLLNPDDAACVERPLSALSAIRSVDGVARHFFDTAGPLVAASQRWSSWAQPFTERLWTFGYQERAIYRIFDALPSEFCRTTQAACRAW
jgi:hypothetical protein